MFEVEQSPGCVVVVLEVSVGGFKAVAIEEVSRFVPFGVSFGESKLSKTVVFFL